MSQPNLLFYMEGCKTCNFFITTAHKANILKNFKMICIDGQKEKFKAQGLKKVPTIIIPSINKQFDGSDCIKWLDDMIKISLSNNNFSMKDEELFIPDVGIVQNNITQPPKPPNNYNIYPNQNPNSHNHISHLTSQISQLSSQLNNPQLNNPQSNCKPNSNLNQFEVSKTNIIKRNTFNPIQPPPNTNNNIKNINTVQLNSNHLNQNNLNQNNLNQPTVKPINQLFGYLQNEMSGYSDGYAYVNVDNPLPKSFLPPDKDMEIYTAPEGDKIDKKRQDQMIQLAELERKNEKEQIKNSIDEINRRIAMGDNTIMPKWVGAKKDL